MVAEHMMVEGRMLVVVEEMVGERIAGWLGRTMVAERMMADRTPVPVEQMKAVARMMEVERMKVVRMKVVVQMTVGRMMVVGRTTVVERMKVVRMKVVRMKVVERTTVVVAGSKTVVAEELFYINKRQVYLIFKTQH
jgi:predicted DNA-binding protein (UPF0251 family)